MADTWQSNAFSLSTEPPLNIQQAMDTEGETTQIHSCNSICFDNVTLDCTQEEWVLLSSGHTNMDRDLILNNYENLCKVVFYFSKPLIFSKSEEQDRVEGYIPPGFSPGRMTPLTSHQEHLTQNSLQQEALNSNQDSTHGHYPPICNTIGESLSTESTIAQRRQMGSGGQCHSWEDSELDPGESSHGGPLDGYHNEEESKEKHSAIHFCSLSSSLDEQGRNQTGEKCHECRDCENLLSSLTRLKEHKKSHTRKELFKCSQCERTFLCPIDLHLHLRVHSGNREYKCNTCRKCFSSSSNLKRHVTIHTGEKPYECSECKKNFRNSCLLRQHKLIHSEQKQHECNECGKAFHRHSHLTRHKLIHTRGKDNSLLPMP